MTARDDMNGLFYYRCPQCNAVGYLPREFCPVCASAQRERCRALGVGTVTATTVLAPNPRDEDASTHGICLVAFDEGFTAMARSAAPLPAGVQVSVAGFEGHIPVVQSAEDADGI